MIGADLLSSDSFNLSIDQWTSSLGINVGQNRDAFSGLNSLHDDWLATLGLSIAGLDGALASNGALNLYGALVSGIRFPSLYSADLIRAIRSSRLVDRRSDASFGSSLKGSSAAGLLGDVKASSLNASSSIEDTLASSVSDESLSDALDVILAHSIGSVAESEDQRSVLNRPEQSLPSDLNSGISKTALTGLGSERVGAAIVSPILRAGVQSAESQSAFVASGPPPVGMSGSKYNSDADSASHSFDAPAYQPLINWLNGIQLDSSLFATRSTRTDSALRAGSPVSDIREDLVGPLLAERQLVPTAQIASTKKSAQGELQPSILNRELRSGSSFSGALSRYEISPLRSDVSPPEVRGLGVDNPSVLEPLHGVTQFRGQDTDTPTEGDSWHVSDSIGVEALGDSGPRALDFMGAYLDGSGSRIIDGLSAPGTTYSPTQSEGTLPESGAQIGSDIGPQSSYPKLLTRLTEGEPEQRPGTIEGGPIERTHGSLRSQLSVPMPEDKVLESMKGPDRSTGPLALDSTAVTTAIFEEKAKAEAGSAENAIVNSAFSLASGLDPIEEFESRLNSTSKLAAAVADNPGISKSLDLGRVGASLPTISGLQPDSAREIHSDSVSNFVAHQHADDQIDYQEMLTVFPMLSRQGAEVDQVWASLLRSEHMPAMVGERTQSSPGPLRGNGMPIDPESGEAKVVADFGGEEELPHGRWNPSFNAFENRVSPMAVLPESQIGGLIGAVLGQLDGVFDSASVPADVRDLIVPMSTLWSKRSAEERAGLESIVAEQRRSDWVPLVPAPRAELEQRLPSSQWEGVSESRALPTSPVNDLRLTQLLRQLGAGPDSMLKSVMDIGSALNRFGQSALIASAGLSANRQQVMVPNSPVLLSEQEMGVETPGADPLRLTGAGDVPSAAHSQTLRSSVPNDVGAILDRRGRKSPEARSESASLESQLGKAKGSADDIRVNEIVPEVALTLSQSNFRNKLAEALIRVSPGLPSVLEEAILGSVFDLPLNLDAISSLDLPSGDSLILNAYLGSVLGEKVVVEPSQRGEGMMKQELADVVLGHSGSRNNFGEAEISGLSNAESIGYLHSIQPVDDQKWWQQTGVFKIESQLRSGFTAQSRSLGELPPRSFISDGDVGNYLPPHLMSERAALEALQADSFEHSLLGAVTSIARTQLRGVDRFSNDTKVSSASSTHSVESLAISPLTPERGRESSVQASNSHPSDTPNITRSLIETGSPLGPREGAGESDPYDILSLERRQPGPEPFSTDGLADLIDRAGTPVVRLKSQDVPAGQPGPAELMARGEVQRRGGAGGGGPRRGAFQSDPRGSQEAIPFASGRLSSLPALASEFSQLVQVSTDDSAEDLLAGMLGSMRGLEAGQISQASGPRYDQRPGVSATTHSLTEERSFDSLAEIAQAKFAAGGRAPLELDLRQEEVPERQKLQPALPLSLQRGVLTQPKGDEIRGALGAEAGSTPMISERPQVALDRPLSEIPTETLNARAFYPELRIDTPALPKIVSPALDDVDVSIKGLSESLARMVRTPQSLRDQETRQAGILEQPLLSREPIIRDLSGMAQDVYAATPESSSGGSHKSSRLADLEKLEKASYFSQEVSAENRAFEMALMEIRWRLKFTERWDLERE